MLERKAKTDDIRVLICEIYSPKRRRFFIWNTGMTPNKVTHETCLSISERKLNSSISGHRTESLDSLYERDLPTVSYEGYLILVGEDQAPKFSITADDLWVGAYSWRSHSCAIASMISGATVCNVNLPEDMSFNPDQTRVQFVFAPDRRHFLVFGDRAIFAFCPDFLNLKANSSFETLTFSSSVAGIRPRGTNSSFRNLLEGLIILPSRAQDPDLFSSDQADDSPWPGALFSDLKPISKIKDAAVSRNGRCMAFIVASERGQLEVISFDSRVSKGKQPKRSEIVIFQKQDTKTTDHFIPERVFIATKEETQEMRVAVFSNSQRPVAHFYNTSGKKRDTVRFEMEACLRMSQTQCYTKLVALDINRVCIIDLNEKRIIEEVPYRVNFRQIMKTARHSPRKRMYDYFDEYGDQRMSDDGRAVLIGWDTGRRRSLVVRPDTEQDEFESQVRKAGGRLSDFCVLSSNGACTCFLDLLQLADQRITVGIFNEEVQDVIQSCEVAKDMPVDSIPHESIFSLLSNFLYGLSEDGMSLVTVTTQIFHDSARNWYVAPRHREIKLEWSAHYPTKEEQRLREAKANRISVERLLHNGQRSRSPVNFLNAPATYGLSAFQEAVLENNRDRVTSFLSLSKRRNIVVGLEWMTRMEDGERRRHDVLTTAIEAKSANRVKEALQLLTSNHAPFNSAASIARRAFFPLLKDYQKSLDELLSSNAFVVEACELDVHADFLNEQLMEDTAVHMDTVDTFSEWNQVSDAEHRARNWRLRNWKTVEQMTKNGESTTTAALQFISIENAAKVGMDGILRPLLLRQVPVEFFNYNVVKWIIRFKWLKMWRQTFVVDFIYYVVFLICFTLYAIVLARDTPHITEVSTPRAVSGTILLGVIFSFSAKMLLGEISQISTFMKDCGDHFDNRMMGLRYYFTSLWNWVDLFSCLNLLLLIPLCHIMAFQDKEHEEYEKYWSAVVAVEAIVAYVKLWYFAQPFKVSGALVLMINNIVKDCVVFFGLVLIILVGFSLALHVLLRHCTSDTPNGDVVSDAYGSFINSLVTMFYALLGTFDAEIYHADQSLGWLITILFLLFMISETIVLFNLLIALMGDTFARVKESEEMQLLMGCARFIDACEAGLTDSQIEKANASIGRYVCILSAKETGPSDSMDEPYSSDDNDDANMDRLSSNQTPTSKNLKELKNAVVRRHHRGLSSFDEDFASQDINLDTNDAASKAIEIILSDLAGIRTHLTTQIDDLKTFVRSMKET